MTETEQEILADVKARTGRSFPNIAWMRPRDRSDAALLLPILAGWIPRVDERHRHAIYTCYDAKAAYPFFDLLLDWWQRETYAEGSSCLTQILSKLAKARDAARLWDLVKNDPAKPSRYMLMARLAAFPDVAEEVRAALVADLDKPATRVNDLQFIAAVDHPGIRNWFRHQLDSPNPAVRIIAQRVVKKSGTLPDGFEYAKSGPDRRRELFSIETRIEDVESHLRKLSADFAFEVPPGVRLTDILFSVETDRWLIWHVTSKRNALRLWFRLEDVDTAEIVLTGIPPERR